MNKNKPSINDINQTLNNTADVNIARSVFEWFSTNDGQAYLSSRMDEDFDEIYSDMNSSQKGKAVSLHLLKGVKRKIKHKQIRSLIINIAAALSPIMLAFGLYMTAQKVDRYAVGSSSRQEVYVQKGQSLMVLLHDGSKVHLNADSKLIYPATFDHDKRKVRLEGEGWFDIAASQTHPFIVEVDGGEIEVTGTQFNVKAYPVEQSFSVELEKGIVDVKENIGNTSVRLQPGEKAECDPLSHKLNVSKIDSVYAMSCWRKNQISFLNVEMKNVLSELSRIFDVEFQVRDSVIYEYSITLQAEKRNLIDILNELKMILPVDFHGDGSLVIVGVTNN